jgi:phage terminase large subunit
VHKLLSDQIGELNLHSQYDIQQASIKGLNGTEFFFEGLRHNINKIKSIEGVDICWVEEAQAVTKSSWDIVIPTIRKDGSEIWITFNPELEEDETYQRFVINPPPNALVQKINWQDNPWFPSVLNDEMQQLKAKNPDDYLHVWEGSCKQVLEGAIYATEIRDATKEGRITKVPYDPIQPVHTFWDLGWSDHTSIWFAQAIGMEYRIIDFVQDRQRTINYFIQLLQERGYIYGIDYLPHDAQSATLASGGRSIEQIMNSLGRRVKIVPKMPLEVGINAARTVFGNCWFDQGKCADGLHALRRYRYDVDPDTKQFSKIPLHDQHSHAADAFRYLALSLKYKKSEDDKPKKAIGSISLMDN